MFHYNRVVLLWILVQSASVSLVAVQGLEVHNLCCEFLFESDFPATKTRFQRCLDMGRKQSGFSKAFVQLIPRGLSFILSWVSLGFGHHMMGCADCHRCSRSIMLWQVSTSLARYHQEAGYSKQLLVAEHRNTFKEYKVVSSPLSSFPSFGKKSEKTRKTSFNKVRKEITVLQQVVSCTSQPRLSSTLSQRAARNLSD